MAAALGLYRFPLPCPRPGVRMKMVSMVKVSLGLIEFLLELSLAASACRYVSKRSLPCSNCKKCKNQGVNGVNGRVKDPVIIIIVKVPFVVILE